MKFNRINSTAANGYGLVAACTLPSLNNLQIFHQEQNGSGIVIFNETPENTTLTVTDSTFNFNLIDVTANERGRGVDLINPTWDRTVAFNYTETWEGITDINEIFGFLPTITDASGDTIENTTIVALDLFGDFLFALTTDENGTITEQNVPTFQIRSSCRVLRRLQSLFHIHKRGRRQYRQGLLTVL